MAVVSLALRYLRTRRIALVAVFSVAAGVAALIVVTSLMDGVQRFYRKTLKGTMADLWVRESAMPPSYGADHWRRVREQLRPYLGPGGPIAALAPREIGPAIIVRGETLQSRDEDQATGIRVLGVDFDKECRLVPMRAMLQRVKDASLQVPREHLDAPLAGFDRPAILLGDNLARKLGVASTPGPGSTNLVTLFSVELKRDKQGRLYAPRRKLVCRVAGCFSTGREDYDQHLAYMDRQALRRLRFEDPGTRYDCNRVEVRLRAGVDLEAFVRRLRRERPTLSSLTWKEENRHLLTALADNKRILVVIMAFIVFVACAAILGLIAMLVLEKVREIGILRSMGMSRRSVVGAFLLYGLLLGVCGSALGLLLGLQLTAHLDAVVSTLSNVFGVQLLDPSVYHFESVPTYVDPRSLILIVAGVLSAAFVASFIPALRAAFIAPARSLRQD